MGFQFLSVVVQACGAQNPFYTGLPAIAGFDVLRANDFQAPIRVARVLKAVAVTTLRKWRAVLKIQGGHLGAAWRIRNAFYPCCLPDTLQPQIWPWRWLSSACSRTGRALSGLPSGHRCSRGCGTVTLRWLRRWSHMQGRYLAAVPCILTPVLK